MYHLGSDGLTIIKPHPQAKSCFAREQGYVVARVEEAYRELAPKLIDALRLIEQVEKEAKECRDA